MKLLRELCKLHGALGFFQNFECGLRNSSCFCSTWRCARMGIDYFEVGKFEGYKCAL